MPNNKYAMAAVILFAGWASSASAGNEISPRIVGGQDAVLSDAPWQAAITIRRSGGTAFCGGVVIGTRWVLTAAHCLDLASDNAVYSLAPASAVSVYTGTAMINGADFGDFSSGVATTFAHRDYNKSNFSNDIALIQLSSDIHANASTVPLANTTDQAVLDSNAGNNIQDLQLSGWGFINTFGTINTDVLQKATLTAVRDDVCATNWATETNLDISTVDGYENHHLCAEQSFTTVCNGDSGGPLVWNDNGVSKLVGIVSFGVRTENESCPISQVPDVFTQVSHYANWIGRCQAGDCYSFTSLVSNEGNGGGSLGWLSLIPFGALALRRRLS
ncbi:trypsin-like serine protease [Grimontia hollisae]|uniref:trypsin-like serine protease n=1 Tax=Grimontia hollisae TaxID=673 RepID=UPI00130306A5|nr:trypsin-like serine protease [Grimontia hollisae]